MRNSRQDIYESSQTKKSDDSRYSGGKPVSKPPYDAFRDSKRSGIIFKLVVLVFLGLISFLLIMHFESGRIDERPESTPYTEVDLVMMRTDSVLDFDGNFEARLILDEIMRLEPTSVEQFSDDTQIDIFWVKQAAMHLLRAERAYNMEQWTDAIDHYEKALQIIPDIDGVEGRIGLCYMQIKDYEASAGAFSRVTESGRSAHRAINNLGVAYLASNRFDEAERAFASVLEVEPEYAPTLHNLALLYYRTKMYGEAANYFELYFARNPIDVEAMQIYTDALIKLNRWEDAARALRSSASELPQAAPIHMSLAYVLSQTGEKDDAMNSLRRGVDLLDRSRAIIMLAAPEYDNLRQRRDFRDLIERITD